MSGSSAFRSRACKYRSCACSILPWAIAWRASWHSPSTFAMMVAPKQHLSRLIIQMPLDHSQPERRMHLGYWQCPNVVAAKRGLVSSIKRPKDQPKDRDCAMSGVVQPPPFELQGHRGARGLKPENTLPAFEVAFDLGVTSIETDVHLTCDGVPILTHDASIQARLCRLLPGSTAPDPASQPLVSTLTCSQLRGYGADRNPDPRRFARQDATVTPLAQLYAERVTV